MSMTLRAASARPWNEEEVAVPEKKGLFGFLQKDEVGPGTCCSPRHVIHTHSEPSLLEAIGP